MGITGFHFQGFLIGIPVVLAGSALCAGIVAILVRVGMWSNAA
jgi:hypothetical protein